MKVQRYCIYNLEFSYTRITEIRNEIEFKGVLSYHTLDLELLKKATKGNLELNEVNTFLFFQVQRHIDLILSGVDENEIVMQRPIIINRLNVILRKELQEIGLEFVDFKRVSLWVYGAADRGVSFSSR
ncbi:MAG: hypothetical protein ACFFAJ_09005 [Candidatus Hodarchaeota archaeon]